MGTLFLTMMEQMMENLSMEERSNLEERKIHIMQNYKNYMVQHPELRQTLNDFITACLAERPDNIYKFARYWFANSLPPLAPLTTDGEASASDGFDDGSIESIAAKYGADASYLADA